MTILINSTKQCLTFLAVLLLFSMPATAQDTSPDSQTLLKADEVTDIPVLSAAGPVEDITHPILRLTPDKSEMIKLSGEAASVIVGNPAHISVLLDTPDTIIVVPRADGASHFTVIGKNGSILMQRHVIVGATKDKYVRIRRSCDPNDQGCQPTSVYFCPDACHEVQENVGTQSGSSIRF